MPCPFYEGNAVCRAHELGVYVPPSDVELSFCITEDAFCHCCIFRKATEERIVAELAEVRAPLRADTNEGSPGATA